MSVTIKDLVTSTVKVLGKPEYAETGMPADALMVEVENELQNHLSDFKPWNSDDETGLGQTVRRLVCKEAVESLGLATTIEDAGNTSYRLTENGRLYFQDMTQS